jgi:parallel beta-helix repeat protein
VRLRPGTYTLDAPIFMPPDRTLRGDAGKRASTVLQPSDSFPRWGDPVESTMIRTSSAPGRRTIAHLFLYGADRVVRGICCEDLVVDDVMSWNFQCDGIVLQQNARITRSDVAWNAIRAECPAVPDGGGSGIYMEVKPGTAGHGDITLSDNVVHDNNGMGIDINSVYDGQLLRNHVHGNTGPAGIGLYEASRWHIEGNVITHAGSISAYHPACAGGPIGAQAAAIKLCQDGGGRSATNNVITDNRLSGPYGVLSIGNDELAAYELPRANDITNNDVTGSTFGCADDFHPGQWFEDDDYWDGNNCAGSPNTGPAYF